MDDSPKIRNQELIQELKRLKAVEIGDFTLASGKKSKYYINIKKATTHTSFLKLVGKHMAPLASRIQRVAGVELGAVPIAVALALHLDLPYSIVRKEQKEHGTKGRIEGSIGEGERVVFVEDVTTTANTLKNAILMVRSSGGIVDRALCVVDRDEGATANLQAIDVELVPLVTSDELLR
jgi:orotate phosphoribosyltransferase